jgi:hypothetical protein
MRTIEYDEARAGLAATAQVDDSEAGEKRGEREHARSPSAGTGYSATGTGVDAAEPPVRVAAATFVGRG